MVYYLVKSCIRTSWTTNRNILMDLLCINIRFVCILLYATKLLRTYAFYCDLVNWHFTKREVPVCSS